MRFIYFLLYINIFYNYLKCKSNDILSLMSVNDQVIKRDGCRENFSFDKILNRVKSLGKRELNVNYY